MAEPKPTARIVELAGLIAEKTGAVNSYLLSNGLPQPSFEIDGPSDLGIKSDEIENARMTAIEAAIELQDLLQGPVACLRPSINPTSLEAIYRWNIAGKVPLDGSDISFTDLARKCGIYEPHLRGIVRYAILYHRVFREPREGFVAHSAASRILASDTSAHDALGMMYDETTKSFVRTCDAMERFNSQELNETAYSLAHCPGESVWSYYESHPDIARRFASSMKSFTSTPGHSAEYLATGYPWSNLSEGSKVIDIGGSTGHVSIAIAKLHKQVRFIVQDLPTIIQAAELDEIVDADVKQRIEFESHDFLTKQRREGDIFLLRWILHDWPDKYVVKILKNLIPVLKQGNKIVINDFVIPGPGKLNSVVERGIRYFDLCMMSWFNSHEREERDWVSLLQQADERFGHVKTWTPERASLAIIEATWMP